MSIRAAISLPLFALSLCSCEKVVNVDINQASPHTVIEGVVTSNPGPYTVTVGRTGDYFTPSLTFPTVNGAIVKISDNLGNADTLKQVGDGTYVSSRLQGVPGRTYRLTVIADGGQYDALSSMPARTKIDSLFVTPLHEFDGDIGYNVYLAFKDPPEPGNCYRLILHTNTVRADSLQRSFLLYTDKLSNGNEVLLRLRIGRNLNPGDTLTAELLSIDRATYDYFNTLNDVLASDRSPTALAPSNPNTNLDNGSLGYFSAYSMDSTKVVLR